MHLRNSSKVATRVCSLARRNQPAFSWAMGTLLVVSGIVPVDLRSVGLFESITGTFVRSVAAADPEQKRDVQFDRTVSSYGKIKLNYYSASWPKVFQDLEEAFDMEFVGDHLPGGRFARSDQAEHTLKDAIRIINAEIEPQGFRLIEKNHYLILLETTLRRPQAPPPAKKPARPPVQETPEQSNESAKRELVEPSQPRSPEQGSQSWRSVEANRPKNSNPVKQVSFLEPEDKSSDLKLASLVDQIESWNRAEQPQVHLLPLRNIAAKPTAELLTSVFGTINESGSKANRPCGGVAVLDLGHSNSLLILAAEPDLAAIIDLATQLDNPIERDSEFQLFRWRAAHVMDVDSVITEFSRQQRSLAARAHIVTCPRANTIVVRARPQDLDEIETWINKKAAQLTR